LLYIKVFHSFKLHTAYQFVTMISLQRELHIKIQSQHSTIPGQDLPDNAKVWRPPAATVATLTPGLRVTRHGNAESVSSPADELSAACFADAILRLFVLSSPLPLPSTPDKVPLPLLDLEPCERGLTAKDHHSQVSLQKDKLLSAQCLKR
jgi:hypothetical protein